MRTSRVTSRSIAWVVVFLLLAQTASATTYMSIEPVPSIDIVGADDLAAIRGIGYANLELWSKRLLNDCHVVESVVNSLLANAAISSVRLGINTRVVVAAGGFESRTNPSFVFTVTDSGTGSVSESDVNVLGNALGYVLNQGSTAHFSPDNFKAYAFPLDYALVTFQGTLTGGEAQDFFELLGTKDEALFSGLFAGFTQIDLAGATTNNTMLFLQPAASKHRFITGLAAAVADEPRASYSPLKNNGTPTTMRAGAAFPENDWLAFPDGHQYLMNIGGTAQLLGELAVLRQQHRDAVDSLLLAIEEGRVDEYLATPFTCPD
jgi:archaellum component FlaF (FlaF/FlaG flagellin family)